MNEGKNKEGQGFQGYQGQSESKVFKTKDRSKKNIFGDPKNEFLKIFF